MGELTFIKDGYATTIHDNGNITVVQAYQCDECHRWESSAGGLQVRDSNGEVVLWLCAQCRA